MLSWVSLQAMTNDSDLNIENNIRKRDTQFISMFWPNKLENQMKCQSNVFDTVFTNNICCMLWQITWNIADIIFWPKTSPKVSSKTL